MRIALYIHIPFCNDKCDYCDFFSVPIKSIQKTSIISETLEAILDEIEQRLSVVENPVIESIFIGGGTPSSIPLSLFDDFLKKLNRITSPYSEANIEFTTEANPESCTDGFLHTAAENGINRISLGAQSFSVRTLDFIGRKNTVPDLFRRLSEIRKLWKGILSFDIISGVRDDFAADIDKVLLLNPEHISIYQLTIEEDTKLADDITKGIKQCPEEKLQAEAITEANRILDKSGYKRYEISNYAKDNLYCRHNLVYWNMQSYIGAGPSAVSSLYTDTKKIRIENTNNLSKYISSVKEKLLNEMSVTEKLSDFDFLLEHYIMGCRLTEGINEELFMKRFGKNSFEMIPETVQNWGLKHMIFPGSSRLNETGLLFLNNYLSDIYDELEKNIKNK